LFVIPDGYAKNVLAYECMNILIEDAESLKFFTSEGKWAKNAADGKCYPGTSAAATEARHSPVGKFNIVGHIVGTSQFVNLTHGRGKAVLETVLATGAMVA